MFQSRRPCWQFQEYMFPNYVVVIISHLVFGLINCQHEFAFEDDLPGLPHNTVASIYNFYYGAYLAIPLCMVVALHSKGKMLQALINVWSAMFLFLLYLVFTYLLGCMGIEYGLIHKRHAGPMIGGLLIEANAGLLFTGVYMFVRAFASFYRIEQAATPQDNVIVEP